MVHFTGESMAGFSDLPSGRNLAKPQFLEGTLGNQRFFGKFPIGRNPVDHGDESFNVKDGVINGFSMVTSDQSVLKQWFMN